MRDKIETPSEKARRIWRNKQIIEQYRLEELTANIEGQVKSDESKIVHSNKELPITSEVTKFENNFRKRTVREIRKLLNDHTERTLEAYKRHIDAQYRRLLTEKLRRLEAQAAETEAHQEEVRT